MALNTSSQLWMRAAGLKPIGEPSPHADTCVMCGAAIESGDLVMSTHAAMNESFNNKVDCKHPGGAVCGACNVLWDGAWLQKNSKSYAVDGQGVFRLASGDDIAAFVLRPPLAAYVAIFNTRQQGHLIWRTGVALPSNYLQVRLDDAILIIDRERVIRAARAYLRLMTRLAELGHPKAVLAVFSPSLASVNAGRLIPRYALMLEGQDDACAADVQTLRELTMGDWWALTAVRHVDVDDPATWPVPRAIDGGE